MEVLARNGMATEVLSGMMLDLDREVEPRGWLFERDFAFGEPTTGTAAASLPAHCRLIARGVPITLHLGGTTRLHDADDTERGEFLRLLEVTMTRFRPDVLVMYGGNQLACEARTLARRRGLAIVFPLHNFQYKHVQPFADADAVLVPSRFSADYHRESLGLDCTLLPYLIDHGRVRAERSRSGYVTFVNPSIEKGVYAFARIADELGRRRPDIPLLVVEGRGTEATVAACGLDLRVHGNVSFMAHTPDPRQFWGVTRVCLLPSLWWENQPLVGVEALVNGIPVVGSDRGGIPETLGEAGIVFPIPDRITPATRTLPTTDEVAPWVEAIVRLWDEPELAREHRRKALAEARRWAPEDLEPKYVRFFEDLRPGAKPAAGMPKERSRAVVLVPHLNGIDWECEEKLRALEQGGVRVVRRGGSSAIDVARNVMISDALHDGHESMMFIDSDIGFDPQDVFRLLARPEPVISGVYAKKGQRALASHFDESVTEILFGPDATGLYPLRYAATGFLRVKAALLRTLIDELKLPLCNTKWGKGNWPFFMPLIVSHHGDRLQYLAEDWAFSFRLGQVGVTPLADTSIRLWHWGRFGYGWEDAGTDVTRFRSFNYRLGGR